jgi:hypothetical protein
MNIRKVSFYTAILVLSLALRTVAGAAGESPAQTNVPDVFFRWAFAAFTTQDGKDSIQPITRDTSLHTGDRVKMMVELQKKCFVYVFHSNQQQGVQLIFPSTFQQFTVDYQLDRKYYVPRGDAWFRLDGDKGEESFYLLASAKRLDNLEQAYSKFEAADAAGKADAAKAVIDLIRTLRKEHRELTTPAERPSPIGGALRGVEKSQNSAEFDISTLANEVVSTGFVARTFTIEHK